MLTVGFLRNQLGYEQDKYDMKFLNLPFKRHKSGIWHPDYSRYYWKALTPILGSYVCPGAIRRGKMIKYMLGIEFLAFWRYKYN